MTTVNELIDALQKLPADMRDCRVIIKGVWYKPEPIYMDIKTPITSTLVHNLPDDPDNPFLIGHCAQSVAAVINPQDCIKAILL